MVALPQYARVLLVLAKRRSAPQAAGKLRLRAGPLRLAERVALPQYAQVLLVLGALERPLALQRRRRRLVRVRVRVRVRARVRVSARLRCGGAGGAFSVRVRKDEPSRLGLGRLILGLANLG